MIPASPERTTKADRILAHIIKTNGWYAGCQTFKDYAKSLEATITTQRAEMAHPFRVLREKLWECGEIVESILTHQFPEPPPPASPGREGA